jgi:hypothetical protein
LDSLVNQLLPVVSNQSGEAIAHIHQDMTIYMSKLEHGRSLTFTQPEGRKVFLFVTEGSITVNEDTTLSNRDSARISDVTELRIQSDEGAAFVLIDLP